MTMTIAQAARAAGVGVETIRFYERRGLIQQPPKPNGTGFRTYAQETIQRVRQAQELGFSLREAGELLELRAHPAADAADVHIRANAKLQEIEDKIEAVGSIKSALEALIEACPRKGAVGSCSIIEALAGQTSNKSAAR